MQKILTLVVAFIVFASGWASAQEKESWRVSAISIGSGESPIASGLTGTIQFEKKGGGFMEVTAQEEQAWFMTGRDFTFGKAKASLYGSVGHFQGAAWVGPLASITLPVAKMGEKEVSVGLMTWPAFFIGNEPKDWRAENDGFENKERMKAGSFTVASLSAGPVTLSLAHLNFLDDPVNWLPGIAYTAKINDDFEVGSSATWNSNSESFMFFIGATWKPKRE